MSQYQWTYLEGEPCLTIEEDNKVDKANGEKPEET